MIMIDDRPGLQHTSQMPWARGYGLMSLAATLRYVKPDATISGEDLGCGSASSSRLGRCGKGGMSKGQYEMPHHGRSQIGLGRGECRGSAKPAWVQGNTELVVPREHFDHHSPYTGSSSLLWSLLPYLPANPCRKKLRQAATLLPPPPLLFAPRPSRR